MAKTTSKTTSKTTTDSVPSKSVPVVETTAASPVDSSKTTKKAVSSKGSSKEKTVQAPVVEVAPVEVAPASTAVPAEAESADTSMSMKLNVFGAKLQQLTGLLSNIKTDYKNLEKMVVRELKNAQKSSRRKKSSGNRQPSGFVKPTRISDELAQFLGKSLGSEMARTDVSKEINAYIRSNNLQDKENGRKINADSKLASLLKLGKQDELTYFNLQRYMKHHFIKSDPVSTTTTA